MIQTQRHSSGLGPNARRARWLTPLLALLAAGCSGDLPGKPKPTSRPVPAEKELGFDVLYGRNCAGCHGADGRLGPAPPLDDPIYLAIVPDDELLRVIEAGRKGTPMSAFSREQGGSLTEAQVKALADGIKQRWRAAESLAVAPPDYLSTKQDGTDSAARDHQHATELFTRACAGCHGASGEGGRGSSPVGAINEPAFLALISDQALRRIIITGRPDLKMPDFAGAAGRGADFEPLSSADIDELVTLLADWRRGDKP